ncbi:MAG: UDP-2,4-diacetamido-2,4,6-trideoxy-beta-L-altropyranose hydrolase [Desulfovibrio sp.]|nr:UDP-2,4-diacetamido-2,4,6-trideoxy-beta-L-altropyranose hydrolase [Desulfovibrio sp.]
MMLQHAVGGSSALRIRADASPYIGTGHVMRCLALAMAAREAGMNAHIICRAEVPWVRERLIRETVSCTLLSDNLPAEENPVTLLQQVRMTGNVTPCVHDSWVVLDGYHFTTACHVALRQAGYRLLVIDDYAHLPEYNCNILCNQNVGADGLAYAGSIEHALFGPDYALLRPEFRRASALPASDITNAQGTHVLLSLGGGDFSPWLKHIAPALCVREMAHARLSVLAGHMQEHEIRQAMKNIPSVVYVLPRVDDMASLLQGVDVCITAGGSTCWELACMGVPFLTVEIAENQHHICQWLASQGYAPRFSTKAFVALLTDTKRRDHLSARLRGLVDGQGCTRVLDAIVTSHST